MTFKIIISYSINDNQQLPETGSGWVDSFINNLQQMFRQILDGKMEYLSYDDTTEIEDSVLKDASALISIVSASTVRNSTLASRESRFLDLLKSQGKNARPVYYVFKSYQDPDTFESLTKNWYPLFISYDDAEPAEITDFYSNDAEKFYWMRLVDLAYDIHDYILGISSGEMKVIRPNEKNKTVFLAETTNDISIEKNILKRELQRHGYQVIPDSPLPREVKAFQKKMGELLKDIDISIHMIGRNYGAVLEGSEMSIVESQYRLVSEWAKNLAESPDHNFKVLRRMVWISGGQNRLDSKQDLFVENIKRDFTTFESVDVIETTLEDFKNMIREELYHSEKSNRIPVEDLVEAVSDDKSVYLIYNNNNPKGLDTIKKKIQDSKVRILEPDFENDVLKSRYHHLDNLIKMDYALIVQGDSSDEWARIKLLDIFKAPGYGRMKPIQNIGLITTKKVDLSRAGLPDQHIEVMVPQSKDDLSSGVGSFLKKKQEAI